MNWILDHLQVIIGIAAAIAYMLNRGRLMQGDGSEDPGENSPPVRQRDSNPEAPEQAERTRRIQEEIRRKIAERRSQTGPSAAPPVAPPVIARRMPSLQPELDRQALAHQVALQEQFLALEAQRLATQQRAAVMTKGTQPAPAAGMAFDKRGDLLSDLSGARNLRRVIVLREVLGEPVGLR